MLKKRKIFSILLCTILVLIVSISTSASTYRRRDIYEKNNYISSSSSFTTPAFVLLQDDRLGYNFSRLGTPEKYSNKITLQKYVNGRWISIDSRTASGRTSINSAFTNLETGATYCVIETTTDPNREAAYIYLYELVE